MANKENTTLFNVDEIRTVLRDVAGESVREDRQVWVETADGQILVIGPIHFITDDRFAVSWEEIEIDAVEALSMTWTGSGDDEKLTKVISLK